MNGYVGMLEAYNAELVQMVVAGVREELSTKVNVQDTNERRYLNKKGACEYVGISKPTLDNWIARGLKVALIDTVYIIDTKDIDEFIENYKK